MGRGILTKYLRCNYLSKLQLCVNPSERSSAKSRINAESDLISSNVETVSNNSVDLSFEWSDIRLDS